MASNQVAFLNQSNSPSELLRGEWRTLGNLLQKTEQQQRDVKMPDMTISGPDRPCVEPGVYEAVFLHHETNATAYGGAPKVYATFVLTEPGVMGVELFRSFNVKSIKGKGKRHGAYEVTRRQDITFELSRLFPDLPLRQLSLKKLKNKSVRVKVRTVKRDYLQREKTPALQYSVIGEVVGWLDSLP
jgi:hypothetical protein